MSQKTFPVINDNWRSASGRYYGYIENITPFQKRVTPVLRLHLFSSVLLARENISRCKKYIQNNEI
jgi:hypothetical protein